ncbi:PspC domain-containing protein [Microbacterium betulae]|uniref:PspC domain-containing protein n=1 Tax=Microbacterium betulae TaxID=2981139 RepID=A0AA97I7F5_9MICO|nr:PspC domain-containing protein [Microbacterium sp. AB]WOF23567.1 PspC domain-containing protein [Microbacterium sp. AB]
MTALPLPVAGFAPHPPLVRPRRMMVAGVAEGLAEHLGWRTGVTRALFVCTTAVFGAGALLYAWLWAFAPLTPGDARVTRRAPVSVVLLGAAATISLVTTPALLDIVRYGDGVMSLTVVAALALAIPLTAAGGVWSALFDRTDPARGPAHDRTARVSSTALLVLLAFGSLLVGSGSEYGVFALLLALAAVMCIAAVWSSTWIARFRELQTARVEGIREEQRSAMAAHLHDSVLQTLALIQNRAGASSEVGRIARAQERELRAWLYDADAPADSDLATDLRDYATALELDYEVAMTVVSAGSSTERASGEVAAAAREAMLNAARHAGGDVSVYIEGSPGAVDVYVRDRGPGFDPQAVPDDRLGVRESIVARMRRIGGVATVSPGEGGTQVHIRYPAAGARA